MNERERERGRGERERERERDSEAVLGKMRMCQLSTEQGVGKTSEIFQDFFLKKIKLLFAFAEQQRPLLPPENFV
jgi:hypothetical protein